MPASGTGIFKKLFGKDKKPLNTQRVVISDTQKDGFKNNFKSAPGLEPMDLSDLHEETFLEDTPAERILFNKNAKGRHRGVKQASPKTEGFRGGKDIEKPVLAGTEKRYNSSKKSIFSVFSAIPRIFSRESKSSNSSALEFAANRKRLGKKGRRNRRIFIYAGTGFAVVILTLLIVFVPGKAATIENTAPGASPPSVTEPYMAQNTAAVSASPSPLISSTPTKTPIPTTPQDSAAPFIDLAKEVKTFRAEADKYYNKVGYSNNHYKYTPTEVTILAKLIYGEARSESEEGKIAVANVVMNRVLNPSKFGNSITTVVTKSQFSGYNPDSTTSGPVYRKCLEAARWVLDWEVWVIPQDIYYYERAQEEYFYGTFYNKIGNHCFYRTAYSGRSRNKGIPPRLFERTFEWPTIGCKPEMRVYKLQYMLNKLGYDVKADKYFGQDTKDAVMNFQKKHGLRADGIAGDKTLKELIKEFGYGNYYEAFLKDK